MVTRLDAQLLDQHPARVLEGLQRIGLPLAAAIEGQHQLPAQAFAEGMLADQRLQLAQHLGVGA